MILLTSLRVTARFDDPPSILGNEMMKYTEKELIIHPNQSLDAGLIIEVTPELAGWEYIHFQSRSLAEGKTWSFDSGGYELALVMLSGSISVSSNRGNWEKIGCRSSVFEGLPEALYLPKKSIFKVLALNDCQFAIAWVQSERDHPARLIQQKDITVEIRGGDNSTRQINGIIRPGFDCDRLVIVEVYTPSGNWSSYPPHKHDVHRVEEDGKLIEADLEEVYYYKINPSEGYAFQRVYTGETSPLQRAGSPIDSVLRLQNNDLALVPEGYHPVVSAPGYTTYYLNVLAGSAQSLMAADDPLYSWVKDTYRGKDPRVPI
jgi:5-deoxy-glucuronate isomerase